MAFIIRIKSGRLHNDTPTHTHKMRHKFSGLNRIWTMNMCTQAHCIWKSTKNKQTKIQYSFAQFRIEKMRCRRRRRRCRQCAFFPQFFCWKVIKCNRKMRCDEYETENVRTLHLCLNHVISRAIATATAIAMSGGDKWLCFEIYY